MNVIAAPGLKVPMEGQPKQYITDSAAVDVRSTSYYRRLINDGSLLNAPGKKKQKPAAAPAAGEGGTTNA